MIGFEEVQDSLLTVEFMPCLAYINRNTKYHSNRFFFKDIWCVISLIAQHIRQ